MALAADVYRITTWPPGLAVPVPPVPKFDRIVAAGDGWYRYTHLESAALADRLYLPASRLPHDREEDVIRFVAEHGLLQPLGNPRADITADPGAYVRTMALHAQHLGIVGGWPDSDRLSQTSRVEFHWLEASYRLRAIRALTRHVLAHRRGDYVAPLWPDCDTDDEAWRRFKGATDVALTPFHVRVVLAHEVADVTADTVPSLYSALVLQLLNDLALNVDFNTCAAPDCPNDFVHQQGRGSQHRLSGVLYCSTRCKNRQLQRRYRAARRLRDSPASARATESTRSRSTASIAPE